jgi:NADPH:quinone reductase-like Zn-dependent oxidoreductase
MSDMRAIVHDRYGPPEQVLRLEHLPRPQPQPGDVLVRVRAASVNSWDWDQVVGTAMGRVTGPFRPPHKILGADIAGVVEAVGHGVTAFRPGDPVFGDLSEGKWGGFADYVAAPAAALAPIPEGLSFEHAAALPQAGALALQALRKQTDLGPDHTVLFNGAGGGVGTLGIQMAKASGARIVAVDRIEKRDALLALGADTVIDYVQEDYTAGVDRYDLIIDVVANRPIGHYTRCLREHGRLVVIGGTISTLLSVAALGNLVGRKRRQHLGLLLYRVSPDDNAALAAQCVAGTLRPVIDSTFPLADGAKALCRLGEGQHVGKVIITP